MKYIGLIIFVLIIALIIWGVFFRIESEQKSAREDLFSNQGEEQMSEEIQVEEGTTVLLETTMGNIRLAFDPEAAPKSTQNFVKLVEQGFYNGLTFHRVIQGFMIQGGDPLGDGTGGPGYTIEAEIGLPHKKGAIAMARQGDEVNPERRSSGSQFYIVHGDDVSFLDGQYTVFGEVVDGIETVDAIAAVQTNAQDRPINDVIIEKAVILTQEQKN